MNRNIEFSVILPICHGGNFLKNALSSMGKLEFSPELFEVFFAGPDNNQEMLHIFESEATHSKIDLHYIGVAQSNRSVQLNAAISQALGKILVFADDDCIFLPDWLTKLAEVFKRETNIGVVGGLDRIGENEPPFNIALDYVLTSFGGTGGLRCKGSGVGKYYPKLWNMAIPREVAIGVALESREGRLHVFDETLDVHEDVELIDRIEKTGKRIIYAPEVIVIHARDTTVRLFTMRSFKMAQTSRSIGVHRLPHRLLASFALGTIFLALVSTVSQPIRFVFATLLTGYVMILLISGLGGYKRTRKLSVIFYVPLLLIVQHFSRGFGYLFPWRGRHTGREL